MTVPDSGRPWEGENCACERRGAQRPAESDDSELQAGREVRARVGAAGHARKTADENGGLGFGRHTHQHGAPLSDGLLGAAPPAWVPSAQLRLPPKARGRRACLPRPGPPSAVCPRRLGQRWETQPRQGARTGGVGGQDCGPGPDRQLLLGRQNDTASSRVFRFDGEG